MDGGRERTPKLQRCDLCVCACFSLCLCLCVLAFALEKQKKKTSRSPLKLEALRSNLWGSPPGTPRPAQRRRPGRRRQSELLSAFRRCTRSPKGAIFRLRPSSRPVVQLLAQHKMRLSTVSDPSVLQGADPFLQALRRPSFVGVSQLRSFLEALRESYETKEHVRLVFLSHTLSFSRYLVRFVCLSFLP